MSIISFVLLDIAVLSVLLIIVLLFFQCWHWWKRTEYSRIARIAHVYMIVACWTYVFVAATILPAIETMCFTIADQELIWALSLLPIIFVIVGFLGIFGLARPYREYNLEISLSICFIGMLWLAVIRTIRRMEPCQESIRNIFLDLSPISFQSIVLTIGFIAGIITIVETVRKVISRLLQKSE